MKQLPEAARAIVERARDAHDPSEAQLQNMLAKLHTQLGYTDVPEAATAAAEPARGLLHAKLLKLVLSLAAIGGMVALLAPRVWSPEPSRPSAVAMVHAELEEPRINAQVPPEEAALDQRPAHVPQPNTPAPAPTLARAQTERRGTARARSTQERKMAAPRSAAPATPLEPMETAPVLPVAADPAATHAAPTEKVLLSDDVVPLQTARKRAEEKTRAASDADELRLIDRAASLLRDGEPEEALALLQEHGRKFPASQLKLERRGLSVLARCGAGQVEQGRRERDEFLRDAGKAPIAARVRRACPESKP